MDWSAIRRSVGEVGERTAGLIGGLSALDRPALGTWTIGDLAAHLTHMWEFDRLAAMGAPEPTDDLNRVSDLSGMLVAGETDRDPARLAARVRSASAGLLDMTAGLDPSTPRRWTGGVGLTVEGLACHAISESLVHGRDLARAAGLQWRVPPAEAALAVEGFTFGFLADPASHDFVIDWDAAGDLHAVFHIKLRTGAQAWFVFDGRGRFSLERTRPAGRPVDCHILADPTALLLVMWTRISQWQAIPKGQLAAWGRKPWLGLKLTGIFRHP